MKVLIAPDKFKGTLTGKEAADCIARGWRQARPADQLHTLPVCDGGDGFGETLAHLVEARKHHCHTMDASGRPIRAGWWWQESQQMAIIESAAVIGLARLLPRKCHPFDLDTFGLGTLIQKAAQKGARTCVIGIGGSATNDGGFGLARALGWEFRDKENQALEKWTSLHRLKTVIPPQDPHPFEKLIIASDVDNPLLGPKGASRIYGPQKGLRSQDMAPSEASLKGLSMVVDRMLKTSYRHQPGAGAAGGLGYGLMAFLGGVAQSGFDYFATRAKLDQWIAWADLVITGEGALDASTCMGKGVGALAKLCQTSDTPCLGLGGIHKKTSNLSSLFTDIYSICPTLTTPESALEKPKKWLRDLARKTGECSSL